MFREQIRSERAAQPLRRLEALIVKWILGDRFRLGGVHESMEVDRRCICEEVSDVSVTCGGSLWQCCTANETHQSVVVSGIARCTLEPARVWIAERLALAEHKFLPKSNIQPPHHERLHRQLEARAVAYGVLSDPSRLHRKRA